MLWFLSIVVWGLFANIKTILSSGGQPQTACSQLDTCGACDKHVPDAMCVPSMHAMLCSYKCGIHKCGHSSWPIISGHVHGSWLCVEWYRNYGHKITERGSPSFPIDGGFHYLLLLH